VATAPVYYLMDLFSRKVAANRLTTPSPAIMFPITATINFSVAMKTSTGRQLFPEKKFSPVGRRESKKRHPGDHSETRRPAGVATNW
jgi:hypothetical protein